MKTNMIRNSGIPSIGEVPWGTHFCHFYQTQQDLHETVIPFFQAGLENHESCLWIIAEELNNEMRSNLRKAIPGFDQRLKTGEVEILMYTQWYLEGEKFDSERVIQGWHQKLKQALASGYDGLRIAADESWLGKKYWKAFAEYEGRINHELENQQMIVMCAYPLENSEATAIFDVAHTHQFVIAKRNGVKEILETPELKQAKTELEALNNKLEQLVTDRTKELRASNRALLQEIDENRRTKEMMSRLNRELRTLSNVNQILMRAENEQTLLNEVCQIVCDDAGYRMAWVGYIQHNEEKSIQPVAMAGFYDGYIDDIQLSWSADSIGGQGPAGLAVRSGRAVYVQDFATDELMAPWRESAIQHGYHSGIALPLLDNNGSAFGVLMMYASEKGAMTPSEIRLQEELSGDLAYGIVALRMRQEHEQAVKAHLEGEAKLQSIMDNIGIGVTLLSPRMEILELNRLMRSWFPSVDPASKVICYQAFHNPPLIDICEQCPVAKTLQDGSVHEAITYANTVNGIRHFRTVSSPVLDVSGEISAVVEMVEDITDRLRSAEEQEILQTQLLQAQKMESIGRLAGGVAHDFNNMLGVIIGQAELTLNSIGPDHPLYSSLQEIHTAAGRSAELTRRLLIFARKQTITPKVLNLNETVEGMLKMLKRLIGEDIDLVWLPCSEVCSVIMDPTQVDQILANLCVNARDAISGSGQVVIETSIVKLDEAACANYIDVVPGDFVVLTITDNGMGMDKSTLNQLFEPFFTTKEKGKGTGLGLATVYGIIKQNRGFVNVYSVLGEGSTFKIFLPKHETYLENSVENQVKSTVATGHETVLLVEDEKLILEISRQILENCGYHVLVASTPHEAIRIANAHVGCINLLVTDVVMPQMDGLELAKQLTPNHPGMLHLFMSGYTGNIIAEHGILEEGDNFIQKPFSVSSFAAKVREILDRKK